MNRQLFSNNGVSTLRGAISASSNALLLQVGHGARFPAIVEAGDWFMVTLVNPGDGKLEIVRATARAGDVITVTRAQEGTLALDLPTGATVDHRVTKGTLDNLAQKVDATGITDAAATGGPYGRQNRDWVTLPSPGPAKDIGQPQVDAVRAATAASGANRFVTLNELAGVSGGTGGAVLAPEIVAALMAATAPSAGNPYATMSNLSGLGGGAGGTVLATAIVNALNAASPQSPDTANPYVVASQLPAVNVAAAEARLTMGSLRALKVGSYVIPAQTTPHPTLGTIPYAMLDTIFGTQIPMPVSVAAALVKDGRSYLLVLMQIDPITGTYSPSAYVWTDDNTLAVGVNVNDPAQPKSVFRSTGQLVASAIATLDQQRLANQVKIDELRVDPSSLPTPASSLQLSLLYEPYVLLEDPAGGPNLFDGTTYYVNVAWKTALDAAVVAGKELFTVNGGIYGHLRDGLGGPFIQTERVLRWLSEGRILQVARDTSDANLGNLCVTQVMPLPGVTGGQALTRDSRWGLISLAAGSVADYSLFRDGGAAGRLAYKMAGVTRYPLFEGDVATGGGGGGDTATVDTSPNPVTTSPLLYDSPMAGQMIDLDLTSLASDGVLEVQFDGDVTTAPPLGKSYTTWFWIKGVSGTKKVRFQRLNVGAQMAAPPLLTPYRRATGITSAGLRSNPDGGGSSPGPVTRQTFTVPVCDDTVVRFVFVMLVRQVSGVVAPHTLEGLMLKRGAAVEGLIPWDHVYEPAVGISPIVAVLDYPMGDLLAPTDLTIWPKFVDVDTTVFSNVFGTIGFAFILGTTQLNGLITAANVQHLAQLDTWTPTIDNTANLSRAVYILARRGNANDIPLTVSGTTANLLGTGATVAGGSQNSSEMRWIVAEETAVIGQNAATFLSTGLTGWATAYSFILSPLGSNDLSLEGPTEVAANNQLVPIVYDHYRRRVRICA
jgi:hypothetical protein